MQTLKERLQAGVLVGSFVSLGEPASVEILAACGFDFVCIDTEHAAIGPRELESLVRGADCAGLPALVRVGASVREIERALDAGASGIVVPRVETAEEAHAYASAARYPPVGTRGIGPGRAAGHGVRMAEYVLRANERILVVLQVETEAGVRASAEISGIAGVDVVFVGPGDLAGSLGVPFGSTAHNDSIREIIAAASSAGRLTGIFAGSAEDVEHWSSLDVRLLLVGSDSGFLSSAGSQTLAAARQAVGKGRAMLRVPG